MEIKNITMPIIRIIYKSNHFSLKEEKFIKKNNLLTPYYKSEIPASEYIICDGYCIEEVSTHLISHFSLYPTLCTCSVDIIEQLRLVISSFRDDCGSCSEDRYNG